MTTTPEAPSPLVGGGASALKECYKCKAPLPESAFIPTQWRKRTGECKPCFAIYMRKYRDRDREHQRRMATKQRVKRKLEKYGAYTNDFEQIVADQNGVCASCGNPPEPWWHIDHDHATGLFRGLLCGGCNTGIGSLGDDPARLRAAADYLERHGQQQVEPSQESWALQLEEPRYERVK